MMKNKYQNLTLVLFISFKIDAQIPNNIIQADLSIIANEKYKYKSLEFSYSHRDGKTNAHFFIEITDFSISQVSSIGISRLQQKYSLGIGCGEYINRKILDIIQYRYDFSFGFRYNRIPLLPEEVIYPEKLITTWGPYGRFSYTFSSMIHSKLALYCKFSIPVSIQNEIIKTFDPFRIPTSSNSTKKRIGNLQLLVHFGIQYRF